MKEPISQYCLRMPRTAYEDALDVALVFGLSMNQFLVGAIQQYVQTQLQQDSIEDAVTKVREARQAGLARVLATRLTTDAGASRRQRNGTAAALEAKRIEDLQSPV